MNQKSEIWAILKEVYGMMGEVPVSDKQIEVVDLLDRYVKGLYKPIITVNTQIVETNVTLQPGEQPKRSRGRPKKS